jgi:hypothetical protein
VPTCIVLAEAVRLGAGSIAEGTQNIAFNTLLLFYYNQMLGLPGTLRNR